MIRSSSKMDQLWGALEKNYGSDGMYTADSNLCANVETLSTGSYSLDDALGVWGIPKGRLIQYAGKESSGKTFMSFMAIKAHQIKDPNNWALFIDAEQTFDRDWAETLGLDLSRIKLIKENSGAKIFERLCGVPNKEPNKPKKVPGLLDQVKEMGGAEGSGLGLIVLDSVAAVAPPMEMSSIAGKNNMALMARFLPPELRKLIPLLSETGVAFIAINQIRVDPGKMFGNPETSPGGSAWKHFCSVMVNFARSEAAASKLYDKSDEQIGHLVMARVDKNKVGPPHRKCEFHIEYVKGFSNPGEELGRLATKYGVVSRPNNKTYIYGESKWVGKDNYGNALTGDLIPEIFEKVKEAKLNGNVAEVATNEGEELC